MHQRCAGALQSGRLLRSITLSAPYISAGQSSPRPWVSPHGRCHVCARGSPLNCTLGDQLHDQLAVVRAEEEAVRARREQLELQLFKLEQEAARRSSASPSVTAPTLPLPGAITTSGPGPGGGPRRRALKPKSRRMAAIAAGAGLLRVREADGVVGGPPRLASSRPAALDIPGLNADSNSASARAVADDALAASIAGTSRGMDRDGQVTVQQDEALGSHHSLDGDSGSSSMCVIPKPIFIISDCTGESAVRTVRAALQQFELCFGRVGAPATLLVFRFVEDEEKAGQIIETAASEDALVVYTLVHPGALKAVQTACKLLKVRSVDLWGNLLDGLEAHLDATRSGMPGLTDPADKARRPVLPPDYFAMIEAVEYTRKMDDGANPKEWRSADLLILGVSRCGKTPLSIFLGQRGYKVANLPLVPGLPLPKELYEMDQTRIVGLTIDPAVLLSIRRNRVGMMGVRELGVPIDYAEIQSINAELTWARSLYAANPEWPVLDVTLRGVEETAARILKILNDKRGDASPQWVEELYGKMARRAAPPPTPLSPAITRLNPAAEQMYIGGEQYLVEGLY